MSKEGNKSSDLNEHESCKIGKQIDKYGNLKNALFGIRSYVRNIGTGHQMEQI